MSEWEEYIFSDFVDINPTVSLKSGNKYSFVEMKDLQDGKKFCVPNNERKPSSGARFIEGDTLFARITPCLENGKICKVKNLKNGLGFGSTEFLVFRGKKNISDNDFVFYLSRWDEVRGFAESHFEGTSGRQRVPKNCFDNLHLELPSLPEQRSIASILSSLDDKIELLHCQNKTLEQLAETLFRQWFVDETDENWEIKPLRDLLEFVVDNRGKSVPTAEDGIPLIATNCIKNENIYPIFEKIRYLSNETYHKWFRSHPQPGDIIFVNKGTPGCINFVPNPVDFCIAQDMIALRVNKNIMSNYYLFLLLRSDGMQTEIINSSVGTTIPHLKKTDLLEFQIIQPDIEKLKEFDKLIQPIFIKMEMNYKQVKSLTVMRDTLLPKLMCGEVRVNKS